jgi:hypothetical protein
MDFFLDLSCKQPQLLVLPDVRFPAVTSTLLPQSHSHNQTCDLFLDLPVRLIAVNLPNFLPALCVRIVVV